MYTDVFYDILDNEISAIIERYKDLPPIKKHKDVKQKKGYGFLIWFLEFYGRLSQFKHYITNGNDDASCDIIFNRTDSHGTTTFFVVQSKWFSRENAKGVIKAGVVKQSLDDFEVIIRGDKQKTRNEMFNEQYQALLDHLRKNGKVKFIIFALAGESMEYRDNVESFIKRNAPNCKLEVIDIERIKRDYIDLKYKKIIKESPLETNVASELTKISLRIERFAEITGKGDIIVKKNGSYKAYVVMVTPGVLHDLFERFGFSLFYKNVRNPLPESNYNKQIVKTLRDSPELFWYFNNGITAISSSIPEIGNEAREIEIIGFQVINGAQTVYSVYRAYEEAENAIRSIMDEKALIMLRLVNSSDKDFNFEITRYTNSQNPMVNRDFHANDDRQIDLQRSSFYFPYWYEKRRGEFQQVPEGIGIIDNHTLAVAYMAFFMEDIRRSIFKNDFIFISKDITPEGLYEMVFINQDIKYKDMLASYLFIEKILDVIYPDRKKHEQGKPISWDFHDERIVIALAISPLTKFLFREYLNLKLNQKDDRINLTPYILDNKIVKPIFENILTFIIRHLHLPDVAGKINFKALEGKETIKQIVDRIIHKTTNGKVELLLNIRELGMEFFELDNPDEFSSSLERAIPLAMPDIQDPGVIKLMNDVLGLRKEGKYDSALLLIKSMNDLEPGNWYIYKEWGITYLENKDYDNAVEKLEKALELTGFDRQKSEIHVELGIVYMENNRESSALAAFEKAEDLDRDNAVLYEKWAYLYFKMGKYSDAMDKITIAVKLDENNIEYKYQLEFYVKKFTDKNFKETYRQFLGQKKGYPTIIRPVPAVPKASHIQTSRPSLSNTPASFDRFVKRHSIKEVLEGEIVHIDPGMGIYVRLELDIVGLIFKSRLPADFDVGDMFRVGKKIGVSIVFFKYDRYQVDLKPIALPPIVR